MLPLAQEIFQSGKVRDLDNQEYPLHSETKQAQCEFLQSLIQEINASVCLEVGLAYGVSSLFIGEAISHQPNRRFISIDPLQQEWQDIGLLNLKRAGFEDFLEFH